MSQNVLEVKCLIHDDTIHELRTAFHKDQLCRRPLCPAWWLIMCVAITALVNAPVRGAAQSIGISNPAYQTLNARSSANQAAFYVYRDADSGLNHGFPSGFFGILSSIDIDTACVDDPAQANGCSIDPTRLDTVRGTVMRVTFGKQNQLPLFSGVNIEDPENWGMLQTGVGYNLTSATSVVLDVRSPTGLSLQFGVGECQTPFMSFAPSLTYTTITIPLNSLSCAPDLTNVHVLFTVVTNSTYAPNGGTILLDNIHFTPVPSRQLTDPKASSFPLSTTTYGVISLQSAASGPIPFPSDQVLRNLTTTYESALTILALLSRAQAQDLANAHLVADAFDYALQHDSHGDPLPLAPDGSLGVHNGYENSDLALLNDQQAPKAGKAGDVRLAGFTAKVTCAPSQYCLVLDGATGGNNAFAILAMLAAYERFGDNRYLADARRIGNWIAGNLLDSSGTGYGGYFLGYPDQGVPPPKPLQTGKSTENNADIYSAFAALARVDTANSALWNTRANIAGDFVMRMYDSDRFYAGTVPAGTNASPGICPDGPQSGNDVISICDFLDANTFTTLAMAAAPRYRNQIDWRLPLQHILDTFPQTITAGSRTYQGFDIAITPVSGGNGIAWEFTGQVVATMLFIDRLYGVSTFAAGAQMYLQQIHQAQQNAPFADGLGIVASTLQGGDQLAPIDQCLNTPFQCIPERVGLAATSWGILADLGGNPFPIGSLRLGDFNSDGAPDLVWQNDATRQVTVNYYSGPGDATLIGWNWLNPASTPGWRVVGAADFDRNGVPDLVWMNDTTRQVTVNYYGGAGGATFLGWAWLNQSKNTGWSVVAVADFDGNGIPDLVWMNDSTRQVTVNYYGGSGGSTLLGWNWLSASGNSGWRVVAAGDFDGNLVPDLVWMNDGSRQITVNYYAGTAVPILIGWNWLNAAGNSGWTLVGANDFDGNGVPDLVWQNDVTAQVTVNYYGGPGGATLTGWNWLNATKNTGWRVIVPAGS
jgi:hypothetical protein